MKLRAPMPLALAAALTLAALAAVLFLSPRVAYRRQATSAFQAALTLWQSQGSASYTIVVVSNSQSHPTRGSSVIRVHSGQVVEVQNPGCPACPTGQFAPLTVEGLFQRIAAECLADFPAQFCNVTYDEQLGFPRRIDTYPYHRDGEERPSITVEDVMLAESP